MTARDNGRRPAKATPPPRGSSEDRDAVERAVLGACLVGNADAAVAARRLLPQDPFFRPRHGIIWRAVCGLLDDDTVPDPITVAARAKQNGDRWAEPDDRLYLLDLYAQAPAVMSMDWFAKELRQYTALRRIAEVGARMQQLGDTGDLDRAADLVESSRAQLDDLAASSLGTAGDPELTEFDQMLEATDDTYDWILPGLLEHGDRVILTGGEGKGKSTLLRQIAMMCAAGIHPFQLGEVPPLKVLMVDLENGKRQSMRKMRPLRVKAGGKYDPRRDPGLYVRCRPEGIDLLDNAMIDGHWLLDMAKDLRPDLLIIGPIYKMAGGDPLAEETAKAITRWLDLIRKEVNCALLIEAHSPYPNGKDKRPMRPYGASLWSRWPEFGVHLDGDTGAIGFWKTRDERQWPPGLKRGGDWPWMPADDDEIREAVAEQRANARGQSNAGPTLGDRLMAFLLAHKGSGVKVADLATGTGVGRQAVSTELNKLARAGLTDEVDQGRGRPKLWFATAAAEAANPPPPDELPEPPTAEQLGAF